MMKKLLALMAIVAVFGLSSCSENFTVTAPYKNITVVYALLNIADTAHYVRIEKAFLDENKSAIDMAKVADSSNYSSLDVKMWEYTPTGVLTSSVPTTLTKVDLNLEGYPKATGAFYNAPNYAYKTTKLLQANYSYRLVIKNPQTGEVDSAETHVVNNSPSEFNVPVFGFAGFTLRFPPNQPVNSSQFTIALNPPNYGQYLEGIVRFHWVTKVISSGAETLDSVDYTFATAAPGGTPGSVKTNVTSLVGSNNSFFSFLSNTIGAAPSGTQRYLDSSDVFIWTSGQELYTYLQVASGSGGITEDQLKPTYTNISGTNVLGLFGSRTSRFVRNVPFDPATLDSLKHNIQTQPLLIQGIYNH